MKNKEDIIEKAKPMNPRLVLTHIIDKNGVHKLVPKLPQDLQEGEHGIKVGDYVTFEGQKNKILKIFNKEGFMTLEGPDGRKHNKKFNKLKFKKKDSDKEINLPDSAQEVDEELKENLQEKERTQQSQEQEVDEGLDYELYGTPAERMEDWVDLVDGFATGNSKNVVMAYGTGGVGKTYNVMQNEIINEKLQKGEILKFTGGTTSAGFLEMLYKNKDKNIILDDFDMIFEDPQMLNIIANLSRSSEERIITKPTSGSGSEDDVPSSFEFNGKLMIISNIDIDKAAAGSGNASRFEELLTNAGSVNLKMSKKETWDLINEHILHKDGKVNQNLKFKNCFGGVFDATVEDREELSEFFKKNWQDTIELSGRTLAKASAIQKFYKDKGLPWIEQAEKMLLKDRDIGLSITERYQDFNDSVDLIQQGLMKAAVIVDKNADRIVERLKEKGLKKTAMNGGFEWQKQTEPNYVPSDPDEKFASDMYHVVTSLTTEKAFFEAMWKHNGKIIIFDKTAKGLLKSGLGQGLMKGALDTSGDGSVSWLSKLATGNYPVPKKNKDEDHKEYAIRLREAGFSYETLDNGKVDMKSITHPYDLPKNFDFKGRVMFVVDSKEDAPQPIQSRSIITNINTNPTEFLEMAEKVAEQRNRLGKRFSNLTEGATFEEYKQAVKILKENTGKIHPRYYDEEGIQTVMMTIRNKAHKMKTEEGRNEVIRGIIRGMAGSKIKKAIQNDFELDLNIKEAFLSLLD